MQHLNGKARIDPAKECLLVGCVHQEVWLALHGQLAHGNMAGNLVQVNVPCRGLVQKLFGHKVGVFFDHGDNLNLQVLGLVVAFKINRYFSVLLQHFPKYKLCVTLLINDHYII